MHSKGECMVYGMCVWGGKSPAGNISRVTLVGKMMWVNQYLLVRLLQRNSLCASLQGT